MPHMFNHARRHKFEKAKYRLRNWPSYDVALRRRGDVRLWISEEAIGGWCAKQGRGVYSDPAIETCLTPRLVFSLALRQTEGFVASILELLDLDLPVPDHTTLSRRGPGLEKVEPKIPKAGALDIIVDSTGLRIHGPGEWLAERHGGENRRQWRKLHLGLDPDSSELVARDLTSRYVADVTVLPDLLKQVEGRIETFLADPAYDGDPTYSLLINRPQALPLPQAVIPPRRPPGAKAPSEDDLSQRSRHIRSIATHGRMAWQKSSGYNRRAIVEAAISRYRRTIGGQLRARSLPAQKAEVAVSVQILNKMAEIGMPDIVRVM